MIAFLGCISALIIAVMGGCGTQKDGVPQLAITTGTTNGDNHGSNSRTNGKILAKIWTSDSKKWSDEWVELANSDCDDFESGETDYFVGLQNEGDESRWLRLAIYNCGEDELEVDAISYWNGFKSEEILYFCDNIAGPFDDGCFVGFESTDKMPFNGRGYCYEGYGTTSPFYESIFIERSSYKECPGFAIMLGEQMLVRTEEEDIPNVAKLSDAPLPGLPTTECLSSSSSSSFWLWSAVSEPGYATNLHWYVYAVLITALVLVLYKAYRSQRYAGYKMVEQRDTEYGALNA